MNDLILKDNNERMSFLIEKLMYLEGNYIVKDRKNENLIFPEKWAKWKNTGYITNQIVIFADNFVYKIYQSDKRKSFFASLIRKIIADIYREEYGIQWDIFEYECGSDVIEIQRRQKLKVCDSYNSSMEQILLEWKTILDKIEERLHFVELTLRLQYVISDFPVYKMKLVRECVNKFEDYGYTPDGRIVLLDDADFVIYILDKELNSLPIPSVSLDVSGYFEEYKTNVDDVFALCPLIKRKMVDIENFTIDKLLILSNGWGIEKYTKEESENNTKTIVKLKTIWDEMMSRNIKLLVTGKCEENLIVRDTYKYGNIPDTPLEQCLTEQEIKELDFCDNVK